MAIKMVIQPADDAFGSASHELDQSLVTVGRSKSCHIELDHPEISRRHFIIKFADAGYVVQDENSRHGTQLDGEKLEPDKPYALGVEHEIVVPGFVIKVFCDGMRPHLERTTVVARQLLDDLLQGEGRARECPSLTSVANDYHFKFIEEKTTFVLGTLAKADFVVNDEQVEKKHLSFTRDIFGIRIIPMQGNVVLLDGDRIVEPQVLASGAVIKVGAIEFTYSETGQLSLENAQRRSSDATVATPDMEIPQPFVVAATNDPPRKNPFRAADRIFICSFLVAIFGVAVMIVSLV